MLALLRVVVLRAFVPEVIVLTGIEALCRAVVTLCMDGNHSQFPARRRASQVIRVNVPKRLLDVFQPEIAEVVAAAVQGRCRDPVRLLLGAVAVVHCEEEDGVKVVVVDLPLLHGLRDARAVLDNVGVARRVRALPPL